MKDNEEKLMENQAEKESCKELAGEKLSEYALEDVSAGGKYYCEKPSMASEIYGNVGGTLKEKDKFTCSGADNPLNLFQCGPTTVSSEEHKLVLPTPTTENKYQNMFSGENP